MEEQSQKNEDKSTVQTCSAPTDACNSDTESQENQSGTTSLVETVVQNEGMIKKSDNPEHNHSHLASSSQNDNTHLQSRSPRQKFRTGKYTPNNLDPSGLATFNQQLTSLTTTPTGWTKYVVFIVGPMKERMFGLKSQLIAKSQAFSEIVYSRKDVEHPEYSPASFGIFLKYINSDNLCFAESHVCDLLRLAFVYEIPHIMNKCREFALATLSLENCLKYHLAAMLYELDDLQSMAFRFMCKQGPAFLHHPSFLELDALTLGSIICRDDFVIAEVDLFLRLLEWVDAECQRLRYPPDRKEFHRRVCGNLFSHVRFSMMSAKEFSAVVIPREVLNQKDIDGILLRQTTPWQMWSTLPSSPFIERPRVVRQWIQVPLYNQVQYSYRRVHCPNAQESLRFLASHDIYLVGIEFFGPIYNGPLTSYKIKYQLENEFMNFYYKTPPESVSILTPTDFEVEFPHPLKITGQIPYKLLVCLEGQISQFALFPVPQAVVMYNNNQISIHMSDNHKETWGSNYHINFNMEQQPESPGIIKSLLFETVD